MLSANDQQVFLFNLIKALFECNNTPHEYFCLHDKDEAAGINYKLMRHFACMPAKRQFKHCHKHK